MRVRVSYEVYKQRRCERGGFVYSDPSEYFLCFFVEYLRDQSLEHISDAWCDSSATWRINLIVRSESMCCSEN